MSEFTRTLHRNLSDYLVTGLRTGEPRIKMSAEGLLETTVETRLGGYLISDIFGLHSRDYLFTPRNQPPYHTELAIAWRAIKQGGGIFTIAPTETGTTEVGLTIYKPSSIVNRDPDPRHPSYLQAHLSHITPQDADEVVVALTDTSDVQPVAIYHSNEPRNAFFTAPPAGVKAEGRQELVAIAQYMETFVQSNPSTQRAS